MKQYFPERYSPSNESLHGGMSRVYKCVDNLLGREVIIKFVDDPGEQHRLLDEILALKEVRSKHVIQIYDVFGVPGGNSHGIVVEYIGGHSLTDASTVAGSLDTYLSILFQVSCGLCDLHRQKIIHRDIKPGNIKIDESGLVKIFDFGLSRFDEINNETVGFAGTPNYAAPELWKKVVPLPFAPSVDVYAFGVLSWHLSGVEIPDGLKPTRSKDIPSFSSLSIGLPESLCNLLDATLAINPLERPSIFELRDSLECLLLKDRHKGILVSPNGVRTLSSDQRTVNLRLGGSSEIKIHYNGFSFVVALVSGPVLVNHSPITEGSVLPKSCVIELSGSSSRVFVTFDASNPEVLP
jgi:eukaryotic-like serine/threonine-protein kinase